MQTEPQPTPPTANPSPPASASALSAQADHGVVNLTVKINTGGDIKIHYYDTNNNKVSLEPNGTVDVEVQG